MRKIPHLFFFSDRHIFNIAKLQFTTKYHSILTISGRFVPIALPDYRLFNHNVTIGSIVRPF